AAVHARAVRSNSLDHPFSGTRSRRGGLHRENRSSGIFQSEHVGGPPNVSALHERGEMPAGMAAEARSGNPAAATRNEETNAENDHHYCKAVRGTRTGASAGPRD